MDDGINDEEFVSTEETHTEELTLSEKHSEDTSNNLEMERLHVCQISFNGTLGIKSKFVARSLLKLSKEGIVSSDARGVHAKPKVDEALVQGVCSHIKSFVPIPSHYCRPESNRTYLSSELSVAEMHRLYEAQCSAAGNEAVKTSTYRRIFLDNFNISFHTPKKDMCSLCEKFKNTHDKEPLQETYDLHIQRKEEARALKK
ncbi:hypothetical protein CAPTEDRAFT_212417 [Capitella teleta]|uniref:Uncharacterized protein n=1 Tax=Capitella teleta TaxID=283909 RepID=R7U758_CAPTE|nr:hypothetical protein CAPTEDRAFT_212417 [Capitella teleta]|eukprot:ELU02205.1 hypothetical protein CAPTEDRAFT_212417 [Capitella teleta]